MKKIVPILVVTFLGVGCGGRQTTVDDERPKGGCACGVMPGVPDPGYQKCLDETGYEANRNCPAAPSSPPSGSEQQSPGIVHD
jgi:hypothetical protein